MTGLRFSGDDVVICLSEKFEDKPLEKLIKLGLRTRFPNECTAWERRRKLAMQGFRGTVAQRQAEKHVKLEQHFEDIRVKLREAVVAEVKETAYACLTTAVESVVSSMGQQILSTQKEESDKQIQREVDSAEERELGILRSDFVRQIEDLTRQRSRSYVHHILEREDSLTQCSRISIHVDSFIPKKEGYYSEGLWDSPVKPLVYLNVPDRDLLYQRATRIPGTPRDRISYSHSTPSLRATSQSSAQFFLSPNARRE